VTQTHIDKVDLWPADSVHERTDARRAAPSENRIGLFSSRHLSRHERRGDLEPGISYLKGGKASPHSPCHHFINGICDTALSPIMISSSC